MDRFSFSLHWKLHRPYLGSVITLCIFLVYIAVFPHSCESNCFYIISMKMQWHFLSSILVYMWKLTNFSLILQPLKKILFFIYWICTGFKFFLSYYRQNVLYFVCGIFCVLFISLFILKLELDYMTIFYFISLKCSEQFYILSYIYI
jgi:hypothetical protein